jgi:hypothetical protein
MPRKPPEFPDELPDYDYPEETDLTEEEWDELMDFYEDYPELWEEFDIESLDDEDFYGTQ